MLVYSRNTSHPASPPFAFPHFVLIAGSQIPKYQFVTTQDWSAQCTLSPTCPRYKVLSCPIPFLPSFPTSFLFYTAKPVQALAINNFCLPYGQGPHCPASGSATCPNISCLKCFHPFHRHALVKHLTGKTSLLYSCISPIHIAAVQVSSFFFFLLHLIKYI